MPPREVAKLRVLMLGTASPATSVTAGSLAISPPDGALVLVNNAISSTLQLRFIRLERNELIISRVQNAPLDQCKRYPLALLSNVERLSSHMFQIKCHGAPPLRFEAHDAFTCKAWLQILGPALDKSTHSLSPGGSVIQPRTTANYAYRRSNTSPRPGLRAPSNEPLARDTSVDIALAHPRRWHVNAGQRGLQQLRQIPPPAPPIPSVVGVGAR